MKIGTDQRGITLVETLLAAGIAAMIVGVLGSAIFLFMRVTEEGNDHFRALHDVQNAGFWITRDGGGAQSISLNEGEDPVESMTLGWTDGGQAHTVTYSLSGTDLQRNYDGTVTTVARYISGVGFSISSEGVITGNITSSPEGRWETSEEVTYKIWPRPTV